jgi:hypothetical protein
MLRTDEILSTIQMLHAEHLDVRTVTLGVNLADCAAPEVSLMCRKVRQKIGRYAAGLEPACAAVAAKYGVPITNRRLAVSPAVGLLAGHGRPAAMALAEALDDAAADAGVDLVGGFTCFCEKGITAADAMLMDALPEVLGRTDRVCASVNLASRQAGINLDAAARMGRIIRQIAEVTADRRGFGCAKLVVFANVPQDNPFMAGAHLGQGEPEAVINVGVSGPGVIASALRRRVELEPELSIGELAEEIKITAFRVTRVGELIGREVAGELEVPFGIVDVSLAPTPAVGDSVGEILQVLGVEQIGAPGSTAAVALLNDAVKKGGAFASSSVGGMSGAFIPVSEDAALAAAASAGHLVLEKLEAMTSVCSVGLDMIAIPGDTPAETIAALIADEMAIGVINNKTTAVRVIPVPGGSVGQQVEFGGLFGSTPIMDVRNAGASRRFIRFGGRIPAPIQSLGN